MKKILINIVFTLLAGLFLTSCHALKEPTASVGVSHKAKEVIVANHKVNCTGVAPQMCYLVKENVEDEWHNYYGEIDDFEYEEGYEYIIKVKLERANYSIEDVRDKKYILIEVISKEPKPIVISRLYDTWGLLVLNGNVVDIGKLNRSPLMDINTRKKRIQASTGCNSFSTSLDFNDETGYFKVAFPFPINEMACEGYSIESEYLLAIEKVNSYEIKGIDLFLKNGEEVLMHFRKVD